MRAETVLDPGIRAHDPLEDGETDGENEVDREDGADDAEDDPLQQPHAVQRRSWLNRTETPLTGLSSASSNRAQKSVAPPALMTAARIVFNPLLSVSRFDTPSSITACRSL